MIEKFDLIGRCRRLLCWPEAQVDEHRVRPGRFPMFGSLAWTGGRWL